MVQLCVIRCYCNLVEFSQMHLSDNSGGDTDTLGPLPTMGNGPGWSSSDDQMSLPPYDGPHQQQYQNYYSAYSQSPGNIHVFTIISSDQ